MRLNIVAAISIAAGTPLGVHGNDDDDDDVDDDDDDDDDVLGDDVDDDDVNVNRRIIISFRSCSFLNWQLRLTFYSFCYNQILPSPELYEKFPWRLFHTKKTKLRTLTTCQ